MKQGWELKKLGEVCEIARGGSPRPIKQFLTNSVDGVNWIKIGDTELGGKYIYKTAEKIKREGIARSRFVHSGSFLLSNSMSFGRPYILKTDGCIHDGWLVLEPNYSLVDQEYLYYALSSSYVFNQFDEKAAGSTVRNLNTTSVKSVEIPLPPLEEQKRIVALLDEAFEGLETARANAEKNLKNAEELFQSSLQQHLSEEALEQGWEMRTLGEVCEIQSGSGFPKKHQGQTSGSYPFYKVSDMNLDGNESKLKLAINYIDEPQRIELGAKLFPLGAFVFPKVGGAILTNKKRMVFSEGCADNNIMGLIPKSESLLSEYLGHWLQSQELYNWSNKANPPSITKTTVSNVKIPLPPLEEQKRIVAVLDGIKENVAKLAEEYLQNASNVINLRQSILQKAFSGELTQPSLNL